MNNRNYIEEFESVYGPQDEGSFRRTRKPRASRRALPSFMRNRATASQEAQQRVAPNDPEDSTTWWDVAGEIIASPVRGLEQTLMGVYGLVDTVTGDYLPDYDEPLLLGEAKTTGGKIFAGMSQFLVGFGATGLALKGVSALSKLGKVAKAAKYLNQTGKILPNAGKGALTDFVFFKGGEGTVASLFKGTEMENDLVRFMAGDEDDGEIVSRLKQTIEGAGLGIFADAFLGGIRGLRAAKKNRELAEVGQKVLSGDADGLAALKQMDEGLKKAEDAINAKNGVDADTLADDVAGEADGAGKFDDLDDEAKELGENLQKALDAGDEENAAAILKEVGVDDIKQMKEYVDHYVGNGLVDELRFNPRDYDAAANAEVGLRNNDFNLFRSDMHPDKAVAVLRAFESVVFGSVKTALKNGKMTSEEILAESGKFFKDIFSLTDESMAIWAGKLARDIGDDTDMIHKIAARVLTYKGVMLNLTDSFSKRLDDLDLETLTDEQLIELLDEASNIGELVRQVKGVTGAQARSLAFHRTNIMRHRSKFDPEQWGKNADPNAPKPKEKPTDLTDPEDVKPTGKDGEAAPSGEAKPDAEGKAKPKKKKSDRPEKKDYRGKDATDEAASEASSELSKRTGTREGAAARQKAKDILFGLKVKIKKHGAKGVVDMTEDMHKGRFFDMVQEYYINSLLSGPFTHVVNITSNAFTTALRPLETMAGGAIQAARGRGWQEYRRGMHELGQTIRAFTEILGIAGDDDIRKAIGKAMKKGESTLIRDDIPELATSAKTTKGNSITADEFGNTWMASILRWVGAGDETVDSVAAGFGRVGSVVRTPSRALHAMDEMFKQVSARGKLRADLMIEAESIAKNVPDFNKAEYVEGMFKKTMREGQLYSMNDMFTEAITTARNQLGPDARETSTEFAEIVDNYMKDEENLKRLHFADAAARRAQENTFQEALNTTDAITLAARQIQSFTNIFPAAKFIVPFVKTPTNIIKQAHSRTPFEAVGATFRSMSVKLTTSDPEERLKLLRKSSNRFLREIHSGDIARETEAYGRLATAFGTTATVGYLAANAFDPEATVAITGSGPHDPGERKALEETGWQPFSFKVGDQYLSYRRLDPFATVIGTIADVVNYSHFSDDDDMIQTMAFGTAMSLAHNFTQKSYLTGINTFLEAVMTGEEQKVQRMFYNLSGAFVPNVLNQVNPDKESKEIRSFVDAMMARVPFFSETVEARRNVLGEEMMKYQGWDTRGFMGRWSPFPLTDSERADPVLAALGELQHPWAAASHRLQVKGNAFDLREFKNKDGQTAVDRLRQLSGTVKVNGKTLRERLTEVVNSEEFKKYDPNEYEDSAANPAVQGIGRIITGYRNAAKRQLYKEYPELVQTIRGKLNGTK